MIYPSFNILYFMLLDNSIDFTRVVKCLYLAIPRPGIDLQCISLIIDHRLRWLRIGLPLLSFLNKLRPSSVRQFCWRWTTWMFRYPPVTKMRFHRRNASNSTPEIVLVVDKKSSPTHNEEPNLFDTTQSLFISAKVSW